MRSYACLIWILLLASCAEDDTSVILPPEKMKLVFYDYLSADVYVSEFLPGDSSFSEEAEILKLQQQVFMKHKITREQFEKSYRYYMDHPDRMRAVIDSMSVTKTNSKPIKKPDLRSIKELDLRSVKRPDVRSIKKLKSYDKDLY